MMKTKGKKRWEAIWELLRKPKRALSIVLSASMIAGGLQVAMPTITAQAAGLVDHPVYSGPDMKNNAGKRTAWEFPAVSATSEGTQTDEFDLHGIVKPSQYGNNQGFWDSSNLNANKGSFKQGDTAQVTTAYGYGHTPSNGRFCVFYRQLAAGANATAHKASTDPLWKTGSSIGSATMPLQGNGVAQDLPNLGVRARFTLHPSADGNMILADYTLQETNGDFHLLQIGTDADTYVGQDGGVAQNSAADMASIRVINKKIIHMVNVGTGDMLGGKAPTYQVFDVITTDEGYGLGITPVDNFWAGHYASRRQETSRYNGLQDPPTTSYDSSFAYSWNIYLQPYQQITKRVAFSAQAASYYVNNNEGSDSNHGTYDSPFKTVQHAIDKIGAGNIGYIYLQTDIPQPSTISVSDRVISIQSTDYKKNGDYVKPYSDTHELKFTGSAGHLMNVSGNGSLSLSDLKVNGSDAKDTAIDVSGGTLAVSSGVTLIGSSSPLAGTSGGTGSALNLIGGKTEILTAGKEVTIQAGGTVKECGLVNLAGGELIVGGEKAISITGAKDSNNNDRNVYIHEGSKIKVNSKLSGTIGVTTEKLPDAHVSGAYTPAQQKLVAEPTNTGNTVPTTVFKADLALLDVAQGESPLSGESVVLRREGNKITYNFVDESGKKLLGSGGVKPTSDIPATTLDGNAIMGVWDADSASFSTQATKTAKIKVAAPPANLMAGASVKAATWNVGPQLPYVFSSATVDGATWTPAANGEIGATPVDMPNADVTITYTYKVKTVTVNFDLNGGNVNGNTAPVALTGKAGSAIVGVPLPSRADGKLFRGWATTPTATVPDVFTTPGIQNFPNADVTYYAVFTLDTTTNRKFNVDYQNANGSIIFRTLDPITGTYGTNFSVGPYHAKGYDLNLAATKASVLPSSFKSTANATAHGADGFDGTNNFHSTLEGTDGSMHFTYSVSTNLSERSKFIIHYQSDAGVTIQADTVTDHFPEESLNVTAPAIFGYDFQEGKKQWGFSHTQTPPTGVPNSVVDDYDNSPITPAADLYSDSQGSFSGNNFTGTMGNRDTHIVFIYKSNGMAAPFITSFLDKGTVDRNLRNFRDPINETPAALTALNKSAAGDYHMPYYGYNLDVAASNVDPATTQNGTTPVPNTIAANGDFTGMMPQGELDLNYRFDRDLSKWAHIIFKPGAHGSLNNQPNDDSNPTAPGYVSPDVTSAGGNDFKVDVLGNDGSHQAEAYSIQVMKDKHLVPNTVADHLYLFEGWFRDTNGDGIRQAGEALLPDSEVFASGATETLTASFIEDPAHWGDIQFVADAHGSLNAGDPTSAHVNDEQQWSTVSVPGVTPEPNYLHHGWFLNGHKMEATDTVKPGETYHAQFGKDPIPWGIPSQAPNASGHINNSNNGKGQIRVHDTDQNYNYVITDPSTGEIIAVQPGSPTRENYFENLYPEHHYDVYEVDRSQPTPKPGDNISTVTPRGGPTDVLIPAIETNYVVNYDEDNDGKTVLVINPADPDSDYAVIDPDTGNAVVTPECGSDGWQTPSGSNPSKATFSGLEINKKYIVVARPKGSSLTPQQQMPDGSEIITDPAGDLQVPKFIVETKRGTVESVNGNTVGTNRFTEAHEGETVVLSPQSTTGFLYWKVIAGTIPGVSGHITDQNYSFTMPKSNVVLAAYYTPSVASPSNVEVTDEVKGGAVGEFAHDPDEDAALQNQFRTNADEVLMNINGADVEYRIVYKKGHPKREENDIIKNDNPYNMHEKAYTGAWSLNIDLDRYVNGRKVNYPLYNPAGSHTYDSRYTSQSFKTIIQLDKDDVDQMDYQLYEVDDSSGTVVATPIAMSDDPEQTAGLFSFDAHVGKRYVMAYSRAYHVTFTNDHDKQVVDYKVRRGELAADYPEWATVNVPTEHYTDDDGYEWTYKGWSKSRDSLKKFDPAKDEIRKRTFAYAFYKSNKEERDREYNRFKELLDDALRLADDYFLKRKEAGAIKEAIAEAQALLYRRPGPTIGELIEAFGKLKKVYDHYQNDVLVPRYEDYGSRTRDGGQHGGSSAGGGGRGAGVTGNSFRQPAEKNYIVGTNGVWELVDEAGHKWAFVLNGGIRLQSTWAKLEYTYDQRSKNGWYHFNSKGLMDYGWFRDEKLNWYYCNTIHDGWFGKMKTGWHYDTVDKHWYYLDTETGMMFVGWHLIDGKWYYFNEKKATPAITYRFDEGIDQWVFMEVSTKPLGSMYVSEQTPDGYHVDANGACVQ